MFKSSPKLSVLPVSSTSPAYEEIPINESAATTYDVTALRCKMFGSAGKTRTYNPSVNSRMLCH